MSILDQSQGCSITREDTVPMIGASSSSLIARTSDVNGEHALWKQAIDQMLAWKKAAAVDNLEDLPTNEIVDTAIDYAYEQAGSSTRAPDSVVPSGGGRIAMEWNDKGETMILEFVDLGIATCTIIKPTGKLVERHQLIRNPRSRKLELQG